MPKFFSELQEAALENLSSDPGGNVAGRIWNNTTENRVKTNDGVSSRALLKNDAHLVIGNSNTASDNIRLHRGAINVLQFVKGNDATGEGTLATILATISGKLESYTDAGKPAFGNQGRLIYLSDVESFAFDTGTAWDKIRLLRPQIAQAHVARTFGTPGTPAIGQGVSYCDASGGAFSLTLPSAVGADGEELIFQKTDSTLNAVTLTGVTTLNTQNEKVTLRSNNVSWVIEQRFIPSIAATYTPTITNWGAVTAINARYDRSGRYLIGNSSFTGGNPTGSAPTFSLPAGILIDTSSPLGLGASANIPVGRYQSSNTGGVQSSMLYVSGVNSTLSFGGFGGNAPGAPVGASSIGGTGNQMQVEFRIPVAGWSQ